MSLKLVNKCTRLLINWESLRQTVTKKCLNALYQITYCAEIWRDLQLKFRNEINWKAWAGIDSSYVLKTCFNLVSADLKLQFLTGSFSKHHPKFLTCQFFLINIFLNFLSLHKFIEEWKEYVSFDYLLSRPIFHCAWPFIIHLDPSTPASHNNVATYSVVMFRLATINHLNWFSFSSPCFMYVKTMKCKQLLRNTLIWYTQTPLIK